MNATSQNTEQFEVIETQAPRDEASNCSEEVCESVIEVFSADFRQKLIGIIRGDDDDAATPTDDQSGPVDESAVKCESQKSCDDLYDFNEQAFQHIECIGISKGKKFTIIENRVVYRNLGVMAERRKDSDGNKITVLVDYIKMEEIGYISTPILEPDRPRLFLYNDDGYLEILGPLREQFSSTSNGMTWELEIAKD